MIQKSVPLLSLYRTNISLEALKILDVYLSKIDSHSPDNCTVIMTKRDLEKALNVDRIRTSELRERLKQLFCCVALDNGTDDYIRLSALFIEAECFRDETSGLVCKLTCAPMAKKYIFNIENMGYIKYRLKQITALRSIYSYLMFLYLEKNRFRNSWEVSLQDLKMYLRCDTQASYKEFPDFKKRVLAPSLKEIEEVSKEKYKFETIKDWKTVVAIRFTYCGNTDALDSSRPQELEKNRDLIHTILESHDTLKLNNEPSSYAEEKSYAVESFGSFLPGFSDEEIKYIASVLANVPESVFPESEYSSENSLVQKQMRYLKQKVAQMAVYDRKQAITNRCAYLAKMIQSDVANME